MRKVMFLQLPALDNDAFGRHENLPMAALYLERILRSSREGRHWRCLYVPPSLADAGNRDLVRHILSRKPDAIACTLYLWNVERTLRVLSCVKEALPGMFVLAGGPEVSFRHPFLHRAGICDAAVVGEGEGVFAALLAYVRNGRRPESSAVALRRRGRTMWGHAAPPAVRLCRAVPPAGLVARRAAASEIAYLETTRGCPLRCTYCRYHHLRRGVDVLPPAVITRQIRAFAARGFTEVRFVDPTFNSHPRFDEVLAGLAEINRGRKLAFFAELRGETITAWQAERLGGANFREIEVGLQSTDPQVLRAIRRPTDLNALERGIRLLSAEGIRVTLDVMYGLPGQRVGDVLRSIEWGRRIEGVRVQCMQTLLLPGTELRDSARRWRIRAGNLPPYGVESTATLPEDAMRKIEEVIRESRDLPSDIATSRFVGQRLPALFPERVEVDADGLCDDTAIPGRSNRRVLVIGGRDLFSRGQAIAAFVARAVREEPDILWQFVLACRREEPLDIVDQLGATLRDAPTHVLDRYAAARLSGRLAARRVRILLSPKAQCSASWIAAAEDALSSHFV